eukprot:TRINITY_DN111493_c0_g1_i1.p1 TRINITY_DN111493_c0_g1~~TRINITY_DN111493_c0_g1_i1.p1  ORF type:complete len:689 (+),score=119.41 TRINITY_DN111493_c0_g1_i1:162-2228(+)
MGGESKDSQIDFSNMFAYIAGAAVVGTSAMTAGGLALICKSKLLERRSNKELTLIAAGAVAVPLLGTTVSLLGAYWGLPGFKPTFGWSPPEKRSKTLGTDRFSEKKVAERGPWDVVIVGSGMGGLTTGSVLSQLGYKVLVLEAHEVAGGSTHDYVVDGKSDWKFPSGLHYTIPASEEMLQAACGATRPPVKFGRMGDDTVKKDGAYDRVWLPRTNDPVLRVISDVQVKDELRKRFPGLIPQLARIEKLAESTLIAFPIWCALHALPWRLRSVLMKTLLPSAWWTYASRTGEDVFNECFADAPESEKENVLKAQAYLCGLFLDTGCMPQDVSFFMIAATTFGFPHEGGAYPEKGSGEMGRVLTQRIESGGGSVLVRAPVAKIIVDSKSGRATGVKMIEELGGLEIFAKSCVVSAVGFRNTARLCRGTVFPAPEDLALRQGDGYVMANIGIKGSADTLGMECANMEILPAGNGMSIFDGCRAFYTDPLGVPPSEIPMMITFPTVKDRAYNRSGRKDEGRENCQLLILAKKEWFGDVPEPEVGTITTPAYKHPQRKPEYEDLKQKWQERLRAALLAVYPQLKDRIEMFDISTPLTIEHYLPTVSGSAIGLDTCAGEACRFTSFSTMQKLDMKTVIPGLWMTGQDTMMIGVPLAQASGLITAMRIAGPFRSLAFIAKTVWLLLASLGEKARQ